MLNLLSKLCPVAVSCALLSSCYTNFSADFLNVYTEYRGYDFYYEEHDQVGREALPHVLYHCETGWYIAAIPCLLDDVAFPIHYDGASYYERHDFRLQTHLGEQPEYHRITSDLAEKLLKRDPQASFSLSGEMLAADMQRAGGEWLMQLPPGARPVPAAYFDRRPYVPHVLTAAANSAPWYAYPIAAVTFVGVDIPCTILGQVLGGLILLRK